MARLMRYGVCEMVCQSRRGVRRMVSALTVGACLAALLAGPAPAQETGGQTRDGAAGPKAAPDTAGPGGAERSGQRGGRRGRGGPATVVLDTVIQGTAVETIQIYGRIVARQLSIVAASSRGSVGEIHARVGDRVRRDDVLVSLAPEMLEAERALKAAELEEFTASIETAGAQLALANQELERLERLRRSAAFSVARYQDKLRDVERFKSALAEARAKADQAMAELRMADINLYNARIRAPFDGVITQRHVEVGNYVSVGSKVITVLNDRSLEVEAEVPANRLGGLGPLVEIEVRPEFGAPFKATVRAVVPQEDALSRTRLARFTPRFTPDNTMVAANQSVIVHIPAGAPRTAVTVHKDAITQRRGQRVVFVADADRKTVSMRPVELGQAFGTRFEVVEGLRPGEAVVVRGNERLRAGQQIRVQSASPGGGGAGEPDKAGKGRQRRGGVVNGERGGS